MSAHTIFERAPIGATITWTDGTPRPSEDATEALCAWKERNGYGRLVHKSLRLVMGQTIEPAAFRVLVPDSAMTNDRDGRQVRTFATDCDLAFMIIEHPAIGSCRVLDGPGEDAELVHLASTREHAGIWVHNLGSRQMVIAEVTADEIAADYVEGRIAA